jgi:DNA-binding transcriptional ArsR family regulator
MSGGQGSRDRPVDPAAVRRAGAGMPGDQVLAGMVAQLSLVADVTRLRVLLALRAAGELCVGDLAVAAGVSDDAAGYALRMLRTGGLVSFRKEGRMVFYWLPDGFPGRLLDECVLARGSLAPSARGGGGER